MCVRAVPGANRRVASDTKDMGATPDESEQDSWAPAEGQTLRANRRRCEVEREAGNQNQRPTVGRWRACGDTRTLVRASKFR